MSFIDWSDAMSVKVAKFDGQHKRLVSMMNVLQDAMIKGKGKDMIEPTLNGLIDYVKTHFHDEEVEMERYKYPDTETHKEEHRKLAGKVLEYQTKYQTGEIYISIEMLIFLKEWLINHIMGTDKQYGRYYELNSITIE